MKKLGILLMVGLIIVLALQVSVQGRDQNLEADECRSLMDEIKTVLIEQEPDLPDEVYTAIMWLRLEAEQKYNEAEYDECMGLLETVRKLIRVGGIEVELPRTR